jgi:hypothetical protein
MRESRDVLFRAQHMLGALLAAAIFVVCVGVAACLLPSLDSSTARTSPDIVSLAEEVAARRGARARGKLIAASV